MNFWKRRFPAVSFPSLVVLLLVVSLTGCSGHTLYELHIDVRSFLPEESLSGTTILPTTSGLAAYLLPLFEILEQTAVPSVSIRQGFAVEAPLQSPPDAVRLRLEARLLLALSNLSGSAQLPGATVSLYLAAAGAADIYTEGAQVATLAVPLVPPDGRTTVDFHPVIGQGDAGYEYLVSGSFLAGIKVLIPAASGVSVNFAYELQELTISLSGYPFGLIPE